MTSIHTTIMMMIVLFCGRISVSSRSDKETRERFYGSLVNSSAPDSGDASIAKMFDRVLEKEFSDNESSDDGSNRSSFNNSVADQEAVLETVAKITHDKTNKNDTQEASEDEGTQTLIDKQDNVFVISNKKSKFPILQVDVRLISDLVVTIVSAAIGGIICSCLGQPVIVGYILAGSLVGPGGLQFVSEMVQVETFAQFGVVFLLFALGLEFSMPKLKAVGPVAIIGGLLQILILMFLCGTLAMFFGAEISEGIFVGCFLSMSSTAVVVKFLVEKNSNNAVHGQVTIGTLIFQAHCGYKTPQSLVINWYDQSEESRMTLQFVFTANKTKFAKRQRLPSLFTDSFYNGSPWLYLIHNRGTKHKVWIHQDSAKHYQIEGDEWTAFVKDSSYMNVETLHFILEEDNTYYVTGYDAAGWECGGYNEREIGNRQMRCLVTIGTDIGTSPLLPGDFLQDIVSNEYDVKVCGMFLATVMHRRKRVPGTSKPPKYGNLFYGDGWAAVVETQHLNMGKRIALTNLGGNSVGLISFAHNGLGLLFENIPRTKLNAVHPIVRDPLDKDKRMFHICDWEGHERHNNEEGCFYTPLAAYVTDSNRLTVPASFVDKVDLFTYDTAIVRHGDMEFNVNLNVQRHKKKPRRKLQKNLVTMIANDKWKQINRKCRFRKEKMLRFQLVDFMTDLDETVDPEFPVLIPIFDMC